MCAEQAIILKWFPVQQGSGNQKSHKQKIGELWFPCIRGSMGHNNQPAKAVNSNMLWCSKKCAIRKEARNQKNNQWWIKHANMYLEKIYLPALCLLKPQRIEKFIYLQFVQQWVRTFDSKRFKRVPCFKWACTTYMEKNFELNCKRSK